MYSSITVQLTPEQSTVSLVEQSLDHLLLKDLCNLCLMYIVPFVYSFALSELTITDGVNAKLYEDERVRISKIMVKLEQSNCVFEMDPLDNVECYWGELLITGVDSRYLNYLRELNPNRRISKHKHINTNNTSGRTTWCIDLPLTSIISSVFSSSPHLIKLTTGIFSSSPPIVHLNIATVSRVQNVVLFLDVQFKNKSLKCSQSVIH